MIEISEIYKSKKSLKCYFDKTFEGRSFLLKKGEHVMVIDKFASLPRAAYKTLNPAINYNKFKIYKKSFCGLILLYNNVCYYHSAPEEIYEKILEKVS